MLLDISVNLAYALRRRTDMLLQIEAANLIDQQVVATTIATSPVDHFVRVPAENGIGERVWINADGDFSCTYQARVSIDRPVVDLSMVDAVPPYLLPGETVRYLMPSRYCQSDEFQNYVISEFGQFKGGARIVAIQDWIRQSFEYVPGSSNAQTTAIDTLVQRQGVCRDFAHVLVTLARASAIPARFASVYAPDVTPQDFHAVAEVYLDGGWHLLDPTGMAQTDTIVRIGVGADAANVAFLSAFGQIDFSNQSVVVKRVDDTKANDQGET